MKEEKRLVPKVRFPEFTEDWEQRKFGDLGSVSMCKRIFKEQTSTEGDIPFYKIGTFGGEPDAFISRELFEEYKEKFQYPQVGDVLISASGTIGRTVQYTGEEAYYQDSNIVWFNHDERVDNSFLKCVYSFVKWSGIEGSTIKRLYNDNFLKTEFSMPGIEEQQKIGEYFNSLDNLITLHQRELDKWKEIKKSMLQKMFPKKGEKVPELRFPGFTGDWEQRKCKDIAEFSKGNGYSKSDLKAEGTPIILYGRMYTKYEFFISEVDTFVNEKPGSILSNGNEVIVPASGETAEDIARAAAVVKSGIVLGGDLNIVRPYECVKPEFLALVISNGNPQKDLAKRAQGKSVVHVHNSDIQEIEILYPDTEEQKKIISYFKNLDNLITLHHRKLEKLKEIKKGMLQQMFV